MDRVLLVRLGALGDIVHALPVAAALRRAFPGARIDWLVSDAHRALLDLVPVLDRRVVVADRGGRGRAVAFVSAIRELRQGRYDVAVDVQGLLKSAVLARASGATRVIGFAPEYLRERAASTFYTETVGPPGVHVVQLNLGLLRPLGVQAGGPECPPEFPIARVDTPVAEDVRERTRHRYAILNPGAAWPNKRWLPDRFGAVALVLRERHGLAPVVLWGPGEEALAAEVVAASGGAAWLLPSTSIADVVALARGAALMVSGDTGPMHVAAAVGTPIVGIFGPTRPARNGPWSADDVTVSRDESCECHHLRSCRRASMCLNDIVADDVVSAVDRRLATGVSHA